MGRGCAGCGLGASFAACRSGRVIGGERRMSVASVRFGGTRLAVDALMPNRKPGSWLLALGRNFIKTDLTADDLVALENDYHHRVKEFSEGLSSLRLPCLSEAQFSSLCRLYAHPSRKHFLSDVDQDG